MAVVKNSFDSWLTKKLQALNTDEGVFGSYIKGILEGDESNDEKTEALESILAGITDDNIPTHVAEILAAWVEWLPSEDLASAAAPREDVEIRLAKMLESQSLPTTTRKSYTDDEKRIREAILAQYSEMADEEGSDEEGEEEVAGADCGIEKNMNAAMIVQQERGKREKAKQDSLKKKEKDKEDREKQKQLKEEKKEKRKTQKGERRR
ncbi:coiled-coil domain-containing protein 43 [Venturia canescens]|uniref:coiled-coil domain-containing protein 43 n=1 Tax=Venturia canescens TaxID=32260 RepID=UPI001C9D1FC3|nr:coiled-coil domain-containing protein 43 [Venturia canescens]